MTDTRSQLSDPCPSCQAAEAGAWPVPLAAPDDPWDEIARQQAICDAAAAVITAARRSLLALAERSRSHRRHVSCDQEDWATAIGDCLDDLAGDTFGCLPNAIARARRELASSDQSFL